MLHVPPLVSHCTLSDRGNCTLAVVRSVGEGKFLASRCSCDSQDTPRLSKRPNVRCCHSALCLSRGIMHGILLYFHDD